MRRECFGGCIGDAFVTLQGCIEHKLGMHWGCFGDAFACIEDALGTIWGCFQDTLKIFAIFELIFT